MENQSAVLHNGENLAYLRAESLRSIALLNGIIGYLWLVLVLRPEMRQDLLAQTWWGALTLLLMALGSYMTRKRLLLSSICLIGGSLVSVLCLMLTYRSTGFSYLLALSLIYGGMLIGHSAVWFIAALSNLFLVLVKVWALRAIPLFPDLVLPMLFLCIVALASYFSARNLYVALTWVWSQYERSLDMERVARERGAELRQALKSLDEATYRLERTNQMLALAYQQAEEARRLKQEFAQTISHELRTPINLIVGFTELLAQNPEYYGSRLTPAYIRDLSIVHRNARHLQNLVNDVLDLARIDAAQMSIVLQQVDPVDLTLEAVQTARGLIESRGLELRTDIERDLPCVSADPLRVRQVLINLLNNAARFTEQGSVTVSVHASGTEVVFAVKDTGVGIAQEDIPLIFQEFRQLDSTTRRRHDGAGLGLAISKAFVELHGGRIWVESQLGRGSTFFFTLPARPNEAETPYAPHWPRYSRKEIVERGESVLLAVTPSTSAATLLSRYVQGCRTVIIQDIQQARRAAQELMPQVILLDQLYQEDVERLAQEWQLPQAVFLRCPLPGETIRRRRAVVNGYLIKPISQQSLWDALRRFGDRVDKVLVVDDDRDFVRLLARFLDSPVRRYQVIRAHSGHEALEMICHHELDLALVDLKLPDMDGFQLIDEMRNMSGGRDIPIVILSGQDEFNGLEALYGEISLSRATGFTPADIVHCVQDVLTLATRPPAPAQQPAFVQLQS
ncbi:MAG: response regulator [Chloroflexi bacterium]|nr:response regulator [Chloroflexota bacterium]